MWVFLCIATGIGLGQVFPWFFRFVGHLVFAQTNLPVAVATAIVLFGFQSGAALATVVGVLIGVPVMLAAVAMVNRTREWYERREGVVPNDECCPVGTGQHAIH